MRQKKRHLTRKTLLLDAAFTLLAIGGVLLWYYMVAYALPLPASGATASGTAMTDAQKLFLASQAGFPARIQIATIHLDAAIEAVTVTKSGAMDVPKDPMDTAWYALGTKPGQIGSAVIDGHVDWWHGQTAVFAHLYQLKAGDEIVIQNNDGTHVTFAVREVKTYAADANATEIFSSTDNKAHLNIVTCDGTWDKRAQQYSKRLVIFTDRID